MNLERNTSYPIGRLIPAILAAGIILGFFVVLLTVFILGVPPEGGEVVMILVGALVTLTTSVVGYYFGSSAGSKSKEDAILGQMDGAKSPATPPDRERGE